MVRNIGTTHLPRTPREGADLQHPQPQATPTPDGLRGSTRWTPGIKQRKKEIKDTPESPMVESSSPGADTSGRVLACRLVVLRNGTPNPEFQRAPVNPSSTAVGYEKQNSWRGSHDAPQKCDG